MRRSLGRRAHEPPEGRAGWRTHLRHRSWLRGRITGAIGVCHNAKPRGASCVAALGPLDRADRIVRDQRSLQRGGARQCTGMLRTAFSFCWIAIAAHEWPRRLRVRQDPRHSSGETQRAWRRRVDRPSTRKQRLPHRGDATRCIASARPDLGLRERVQRRWWGVGDCHSSCCVEQCVHVVDDACVYIGEGRSLVCARVRCDSLTCCAIQRPWRRALPWPPATQPLGSCRSASHGVAQAREDACVPTGATTSRFLDGQRSRWRWLDCAAPLARQDSVPSHDCGSKPSRCHVFRPWWHRVSYARPSRADRG